MQITEENFNQYLQRPDTPTIPSAYLSEIPSDKNFMKTPIQITEPLDTISNLDSSINEKTFRIIFKIKKYYIICI